MCRMWGKAPICTRTLLVEAGGVGSGAGGDDVEVKRAANAGSFRSARMIRTPPAVGDLR